MCVCVCLKGGTSSSCGSTRLCRLWPSTCPVVFSSLSCSNVSLFWSIDLASDSSLPSDELCCLSCQPQMQNAQQTCTPPIRLSRTDRGGSSLLFFWDLFFLYLFIFFSYLGYANIGNRGTQQIRMRGQLLRLRVEEVLRERPFYSGAHR